MSLRSSRKILCVLFTVIIAIGGLLTVGSVAVRCTIGSQEYMEKVFNSDTVKTMQDEHFKKRLEVIASKSDIPFHVFEAVFSMDESYSESVVKRVFTGGDTSMFSRDKIDLFEELCTEYLEGNNISYNADQIHNTALEAALAYADSYGVNNTESVTEFINQIVMNFGKFASTGMVLLAIGIVLINIVFSERRAQIKYTASAFIACGLSLIFFSAAGLIFGIGRDSDIVPQIYSVVSSRVVSTTFLMMIIIGLIIVAASGFVTYKCFKSDQKEKRG